MSVALYMDVHVKKSITLGLRRRGVDVLTAQEDGAATLDDPSLMDRATSLNRVLFSNDQDMLQEAARRQRSGELFSGLVYAHQEKLSIGATIADLELIAKVYDARDMADRVEYLPL